MFLLILVPLAILAAWPKRDDVQEFLDKLEREGK